jgi:hypothetical protein
LFICPFLARDSNEFVISSKIILVKLGLIAKRTLELNLSKVESLLVNQIVIGKILRFGDVVIVGTGGTSESFIDIRKPSEFRKKY